MALIQDRAILIPLVLLAIVVGGTMAYGVYARYMCRKYGHVWNDDREVCKRCGHEFKITKQYRGPWR